MVRLRTLLRHREGLVAGAATHVQRMQKAMMQMNVQLHHVVADITGMTGLRMIRDIVAGVHDPSQRAQRRDRRGKQSVETIQQALTGPYQPAHLFALRQTLALYDVLQAQIGECDHEIAAVLDTLNADRELPATALAKVKRTKGRNEPDFDVRRALYVLLGTDLTRIHALGPHTILRIISECGTDMQKWPTEKHFTSWLTLAAGNKISGGRVLRARTRRSSNRVAALLRIAAVSIGRTQTALGAFYRRLGARIGKAKAVTATARKLAVLFYNALRFGMEYVDPGMDYYETKYRERMIEGLERRAKQFGLEIIRPQAALTSGVS